MARVVVAGSGFAGLEAVEELSRLGVCEKHDCLWLAPRGRMVFTPLVPALVSGTYRVEDIAWSVRGLASRLGVELVDAGLEAVEEGRARLSNGETIEYDYLVIAAGARPAYYGVPGAEEHSVTPYTPEAALELRRRLEAGAERLLVVGAGFVGVEVAAEALALIHSRGLETEVVLADLLPEPLALLGNPLASRAARRILEGMGARLVMGQPVVEVRPGAARLRDGTVVEADVIAWTAGFRGPGIELPRESLGRGGFIQVDQGLRVKGLKRVYAVGDAAALPGPREGCPALKMAREALRSGLHAARAVAAELGLAKHPGPYRARLHACAPQAGVSLADHGILVIGKALALESTIPQYYHEHLRRAYAEKLGS